MTADTDSCFSKDCENIGDFAQKDCEEMKKRRAPFFFRYLILSILGLEWWRLGGEGGVGFVAVEVVFEDDVAAAFGVGF